MVRIMVPGTMVILKFYGLTLFAYASVWISAVTRAHSIALGQVPHVLGQCAVKALRNIGSLQYFLIPLPHGCPTMPELDVSAQLLGEHSHVVHLQPLPLSPLVMLCMYRRQRSFLKTGTLSSPNTMPLHLGTTVKKQSGQF